MPDYHDPAWTATRRFRRGLDDLSIIPLAAVALVVNRVLQFVLVILGAVLWLPFSFAAATVMHAVLIAHVASWPAWTQLLHPLATIIAKSKLLVVPVYPAAWPQAKKHPFVQVIFRGARAIQRVNAI